MTGWRFWIDRGGTFTDDARDLLARVHDGFTEGFDTMDLKDARAPLDALK